MRLSKTSSARYTIGTWSRLLSEITRTLKAIGASEDAANIAASFTTEQTKFLIVTYNSVIEYIHLNLKKDSYVTSFSPSKKLEKPSINDAVKD